MVSEEVESSEGVVLDLRWLWRRRHRKKPATPATDSTPKVTPTPTPAMEGEDFAVSAVGMRGTGLEVGEPDGVAGVLFSSAWASGVGVGVTAAAAGGSEDVAGAVVSSARPPSMSGVGRNATPGDAVVVAAMALVGLEVVGSGGGIAATREDGGGSLSGLGSGATRVATGSTDEPSRTVTADCKELGGAVVSAVAALKVDEFCTG